MRVAGGLLFFIARTVGIQRKGLCQCGKVILGTPDGLRTSLPRRFFAPFGRDVVSRYDLFP